MSKKIYVWDPLVRVFHWTLMLAFVVAYLTGDEENAIHIYSGYYILGLLAFRVLWGFIGTKYARFTSFTFSPVAVVSYLSSLFSKDSGEKYIGHNPAGSWMVIIMLISLLATGFSGLKVYGAEGYGPLAQTSHAINFTPQQKDTGLIKVSRYERDHDEENENEQEGHGDSEEFWEEIHEFFANFSVLLVILHILGVMLSSNKHGQNLVRAMIIGYKHT